MSEILNDESFGDFLKNNDIAFVDFFNEGCIPCRRVSPLISRLETTFDTVKFGKIKIAANENTVKKYAVEAAPTLIVFKNGVEAARHRGVATAQQLTELIENVL